MTINPLAWVRDAFRAAALGGIQDALAELSTPDGLAAITVRVELPALAGPPADGEAAKKPGKGGGK